MRTVTKSEICREILEIINNTGRCFSFCVVFNIGLIKGIFEPEIEINWSSCTLNPTAARTAACLHSQITDLACRLQVLLDEVQVKIGEEE